MNYQSIITIEPGKRSGKPCICGMRIYPIKLFLKFWTCTPENFDTILQFGNGEMESLLVLGKL